MYVEDLICIKTKTEGGGPMIGNLITIESNGGVRKGNNGFLY